MASLKVSELSRAGRSTLRYELQQLLERELQLARARQVDRASPKLQLSALMEHLIEGLENDQIPDTQLDTWLAELATQVAVAEH